MVMQAEELMMPAFTLPEPFTMPAPTFDPLFGANVSSQPQIGVGQPGMSLNQSVSAYPTSRLGVIQRQRELAMLQSRGLPLDAHPRDMTLEQAQEQTDTAIAKVATVNPELAQQMLEARNQGEEVDTGQGILHRLLNLPILGDALKGGAKLLEVITRPARVIPTIIHDRDDSDPWYVDAWQALTGESHIRWTDALGSLGMEEGKLRAGLGLVFDILNDPIMYIGIGAMGTGLKNVVRASGAAGMATKLRQVGKFDAVVDVVNKGRTAGGMQPFSSPMEAISHAHTAWKQSGFTGRAIHVSDESLFGALGQANEAAALQLLREGSQIAHKTSELVQTVGFKGMLGVMEREGVPRAVMQATFKELLKAGNWGGRAGWLLGKGAAGAMGGLHWRFAIPFTKTRWVSNPIGGRMSMYMPGLSNVRRFLNGTVGMKRLSQAIAKGHPNVGYQDITNWVELGGSAARAMAANPKLADVLGFHGLREPLIRWSDRIGRSTRTVTPSQGAFRGGGLARVMMSDYKAAVKSTRRNIAHTLSSEHRSPYGGPPTTGKRLAKQFRNDVFDPVRRGDLQQDDVIEFIETHIDTATSYRGQPGKEPIWRGHREFWEGKRAETLGDLTPEQAAELPEVAERLAHFDKMLARGDAVAQRIGDPQTRKSLMMMADMMDAGRTRATLEGLQWGDVTFPVDAMPVARTQEARAWAGATADPLRDVWTVEGQKVARGRVGWLVLDDAEMAARVGDQGIGVLEEGWLANGGRKVVFGGAQPENSVPVVVRTGPTGGVVEGGAEFAEYATLRQQVKAELDAIREAAGGRAAVVDDFLENAPEMQFERVLADRMRENGLVAAIGRESDAGIREVTVFDPAGMKVANDAARSSTAEGMGMGYWHRRLAPEIREQFNRRMKADDELWTSYDVSLSEHQMMREVQGKSFLEAEALVRQRLKSIHGIQLADDAQVFDRDLFRTFMGYFDGIGHDIGMAMMGRGALRMRALGLHGQLPSPIENPVHAIRKFWEDAPIEAMGEKVMKATASYEARVGAADRLTQNILRSRQEVFDQLQASLTGDAVIGLNRVAPVMRRIQRDAREFGKIATKERGRVAHELRVVRSQLREARKMGDDETARGLQATVDDMVEYRRMLDDALETGKATAYKPEPWRQGRYGDVAELVPLTTLRRLDQTPRRGVEGLKRSIREEGVKEPLIVEYSPQTGEAALVEGSHRLAAARELGIEALPVRVVRSRRVHHLGDRDLPVFKKLAGDESGYVPGDLRPSQVGISTRQSGNERLLQAMNRQLADVEAFGERAGGALERWSHQLTGQERRQVETMYRLQAAQDAMDTAKAKLHTNLAEMRSPLRAEPPANRAGWQQITLDIPGIKGQWMPNGIAAELASAFERFGGRQGLRSEWRKFLGWWKTWATVPSPGFHMRNMMGIWWNNLLGGVEFMDYTIASRMWRAHLQAGATGKGKWVEQAIGPKIAGRLGMSHPEAAKMTYWDLWNMATDAGVTSPNASMLHDIATRVPSKAAAPAQRGAMEFVAGRGAPRTPIGRGTNWWKGMGGRVMSGTESLGRGAAFVSGMHQTGGDILSARSFTMMRHGDYVDLNNFEEGMKDVIPFYKWLRMNTPLQFQNIVENPAAALTVTKLRDTFLELASDEGTHDERMAKIPAWMRDEIFVTWKKGQKPDEMLGAMLLDLPLSDINTSLAEFFSSGLPGAKEFIEAHVIEKETFTGRPLTQKRVPLALWAKPLQPFLEGLGLAQRDTDNNVVIPEKTEHMLRIFPMFSRFRRWLLSEEASAPGARLGAFYSFGLGMQYRTIAEETLTSNEMEWYYRNMLPVMEQMRSMGIEFPDKTMLSPDAFRAFGLPVPEGR